MSKRFDHKAWLVKPGAKFGLGDWPTEVDPLYSDEATTGPSNYKEQLDLSKKRLAKLQERLIADSRYGLLIIFQGMDASGKDGAIKHVMSCLNPLGSQATSFGPPSDEELKHDFLWRAHARLPSRGKIGIFDRSYYEETLIVRLHKKALAREKLPPETAQNKTIWKDRLDDIEAFENYLHHQGYRVVKFFLHVSKKEQKARLAERAKDPAKRWKYDAGDMKERKLWKKYQRAYEDSITATSTKTAPWYIVPADDKKNARILISEILLSLAPMAFPALRK
jgi:PPK2 family polyphosphate:nucleotide phosphotransferase